MPCHQSSRTIGALSLDLRELSVDLREPDLTQVLSLHTAQCCCWAVARLLTTVAILLQCCLYAVVMVLLFCCDAVAMLFLCFISAVAMLWCTILLLWNCDSVVTLYTVAMVLL